MTYKATKAQTTILNWLMDNRPRWTCPVCQCVPFPHAYYEPQDGWIMWWGCNADDEHIDWEDDEKKYLMADLMYRLRDADVSTRELEDCGFVIME